MQGVSVSKPAKPSAEFPLFAHSNGRWAKKIDRGKHRYFSSWKNPPEGDPTGAETALREYVERYPQKDGKILRVDSAHDRKSPLCFHRGKNVKQWYKTINGVQRYFGTDHEEALKRYLNEKDDLEAGIVPNRAVEERDCRLVDLVNAFLTHRKQQVEAGEKSQSGFIVYKRWGETGECRH